MESIIVHFDLALNTDLNWSKKPDPKNKENYVETREEIEFNKIQNQIIESKYTYIILYLLLLCIYGFYILYYSYLEGTEDEHLRLP